MTNGTPSFSPLFSAALFFVSLAACHKAPPVVRAEPRQRLSQLTLTQSEAGQTLWTLDASTTVLADADSDGSAIAYDPRMSFYKNGKLASRLRADRGDVDINTNDVTLSSGVVVHSLEDDSTLRTSQLLFSSKERRFHTDQDVVVERPGAVVHGRGLEASPDLSDIRIFHQQAVMTGQQALQ